MKFIKLTALALLTSSFLLVTAPAHAFAIYNESDNEICISKWYSVVKCYAKIAPHSKFSGEKGAGLKTCGPAEAARTPAIAAANSASPRPARPRSTAG